MAKTKKKGIVFVVHQVASGVQVIHCEHKNADQIDFGQRPSKQEGDRMDNKTCQNCGRLVESVYDGCPNCAIVCGTGFSSPPSPSNKTEPRRGYSEEGEIFVSGGW